MALLLWMLGWNQGGVAVQGEIQFPASSVLWPSAQPRAPPGRRSKRGARGAEGFASAFGGFAWLCFVALWCWWCCFVLS